VKLGSVYLDGKIVPIVQGAEGQAHNLLDVCKKLEISQINSVLDLINLSKDEPNLLNNIRISTEGLAGFEPIDWAPPIVNPSKILGVAFNNKELMKKAHKDPGVPNYFLKPPSALQAHEKPIIVDPDWGAVIPEPEICAVIGKRAKHITEEEALNYVFGYMIHNDVTSHGLKFQKDSIAVTYDKDMARPEFYTWRNLNGPDDTDAFYVYHTRSKGTDTFGPIGPWLTTSDDVPNPNNLNVVGYLDDEIFTEDHTGNYRFSVEKCISEASKYFTLEAGDLISFGTTGKGVGRFPRGHKSLLLGEETGFIHISIDNLGTLSNPIKHQKGGA
jgi:2-keto-4-pentenoate hydratase/2-oxohepta-3-ene-1,7-dioic acid hydratase in catechol pathway